MLKTVLLFYNTAKYLKIVQIVYRIKLKLSRVRVDLTGAPEVSITINDLKSDIKCQQKMFGNYTFKFLNKEFTLSAQEDWNSANQEKLWLYNLHYFDDLKAVESNKRKSWHYNLIQKWIDENPPGHGNGWEPYPSSLRIVNWIKWALFKNDFKKEWLYSLTIQTRFLIKNLEYHLLGNHLFANSKALIFSGLYFDGSEANQWYQHGIRILSKELPEQVLADGGNFELSPMYHAIFLEDLLDIINIHQVYEKKLPENIISKVIQMIEWLKYMSHPDGEIAFFNDSTLGVASKLSELENYTNRLNISYPASQDNQLKYLKDSGYIRINCEDLAIIADVAEIGPSYIPGHGHADALSFELSLFGKRLIVNSGISIYQTGSERNFQRGTQAHSTITIDDNDSSQVWGGFRVAKRANIFNVNTIKKDNYIKFSACHDGYKRLNGRVIHCREWSLSGNLFEVRDHISGKGVHKIASVLPLHPEIVVGRVRNNTVELFITGKKVLISFKGKGTLNVKPSYYYPEFGLAIANKRLIFNYNGDLPYTKNINISW